MSNATSVTDAEWVVLQALWDHGRATAREIAADLGPQQVWATATVKTLLSRLVEKRVVHAEPDPQNRRRFLYRAAVSPETARRDVTRSFLSRVFDGDAAAGVLHLVENADLSPEQVRQLREALDSATKQRRSGRKGGRR